MACALFACDADRIVRAALQVRGVWVYVVDGGIRVISYAHAQSNWVVGVRDLRELGYCLDCSHAFTLMLELLHGHPEVDIGDLDRIRQVFKWRMRKKGLAASDSEVVEEEKALTSALSLLRNKRTDAARESEAVKIRVD